jgi:hypothetical protein
MHKAMPLLVALVNLDLATLSILGAEDATASPSSTRTIFGDVDWYTTDVAELLFRDWLLVRDSLSPRWQRGPRGTGQNRIFILILVCSSWITMIFFSGVKCVALLGSLESTET